MRDQYNTLPWGEVITFSLRFSVAVVVAVGVAVVKYVDFVVSVMIAVENQHDVRKSRLLPQPQP